MDELLDIDAVASWLKVSRSKVFELIREEGFPCVKMGSRTLRFDRQDVTAWINRQKQSA